MLTDHKRIKLAIERLQPGIYIEMPVAWNDHPFMFNQFKISSIKQIDLLRKVNIMHVWAIPTKSSAKPLPESAATPEDDLVMANDQELDAELTAMNEQKSQQIEQMQAYRRAIKKCESDYHIALSKVRALTHKVQSRPLQAMIEATEVIHSMSDALLVKDNIVLHLVDDDRDDSQMQQHAICVSMLAMMIAKQLGLEQSELIELGIAGLLHDIGKLKIPQQFFTGTDITPSKRKFVIEKHPSYSVDYLNLSPDISDTVKKIVVEHHEFANGTGYPTAKTISQLHPLSLNVSLVNFYESLCHPSAPGTKSRSRAQAIAFIFKNKAKLFDQPQLNAFIKTMGIYPPGTFVQLSSEQYGIVITADSNRLLFPNVLIYDPDVPRNEAAIINTKQESIKIDKVLAPTSMPQEIAQYLNPRESINFYLGWSAKIAADRKNISQ